MVICQGDPIRSSQVTGNPGNVRLEIISNNGDLFLKWLVNTYPGLGQSAL